MKKIFLLFLSALLFSGCKPGAMEPIRTDGQRFVDSRGNTILFHGINLVEKNPALGYIHPDTAGLFDRLQDWGFNCVRLGIIWDGAEPDPGRYDESYLDKIEEIVNRLAKRGIYTLLDMHQDLYGRRFSDGAPNWATLTDSLPHATGAIWSDSYLISPAVQRAFDHFWNNSPAPDGIGIQDHYANLWKHIADRFKNHPAILGYDIMNEPFNGSQGLGILPSMLKAYAVEVAGATGRILSEEEVGEIWADETKRIEALEFIEDGERYRRVIDAASELNAQFERTQLQSMYQRAAEAIRQVDTVHILFLEHAYFANSGLKSAIRPVKRPDGSTDPLVAYGAHGYDLLTDTKLAGSHGESRVELIFSRIREASRDMNVPVLVGEWGAFHGNSPEITESVKHILNLFEKYRFSHTYWAYYKGIENDPYFKALVKNPR